jgi:hypothetical protein
MRPDSNSGFEWKSKFFKFYQKVLGLYLSVAIGDKAFKKQYVVTWINILFKVLKRRISLTKWIKCLILIPLNLVKYGLSLLFDTKTVNEL